MAFSHCDGIGPMRFTALMKHFKSAQKAYEANLDQIKKVIEPRWAEKFIEFRSRFDQAKKFEELKKKQIKVVPFTSRSYPKQLCNISDPPICLYVKGNIEAFDFDPPVGGDYYFAVVGTRKPTSYGIQIAKKFSSELAQSGFIIVSGMAIGIDTIAHRAALEAGTRTIAVLGCGVDIVYPPSNRSLYEDILRTGGLIISEFPPGHTVLPGLFVARNRIISGLSKGVLVVEGAKDSGALITARYGVEQGKEVFAPPGPITSEMSEAPNSLLKKGAKLVTSIDDILEEFNLKLVPRKKEEIEEKLNAEEKILFQMLRNEPKLSDEIITELEIPVDKVMNLLSILEIKGIVEKNSEGKYQIRS